MRDEGAEALPERVFEAMGFGSVRPGASVPVRELLRAGVDGVVKDAARTPARWIFVRPVRPHAQVDPDDLREHGLDETFFDREALELLPVDYALAAEQRARIPANPDPAGESELTRQILVFLTLALVAAAVVFAALN